METFIVLSVILGMVSLAVLKIRKDKKNKKPCSGCSGCPVSSGCHSSTSGEPL